VFVEITDPSDARIDAYRDVRSRDPNEGFIAEGPLVVGRLLRSGLSIRSLLFLKGQESRFADSIPDTVPTYIVEREIGKQIAGYDFHRGVLAHAEIPPMLDCQTLIQRRPKHMLAMIGVGDPENVGSLLRSAAAMGVYDILIGPGTIPPFVRRVVRVSMASVFQHRFYRFDSPHDQIMELQNHSIHFAATTLARDAVAIDRLPESIGEGPVVLLVGNEAKGLDADVQSVCRVRTTLPMPEQVDSLNVGVAGAIFLYELTKAD